MSKYTFIRIPGIFTSRKWHHQDVWEKKIQEYFPESTTFLDYLFYSPWQRKKINKYIDSLIKKIEDSPNPVVLIGMSYGGFIAGQVAKRLQKNKQPIYIVCYGIPFFLNSHIKLDIPTMHFYGREDLLVPASLSKYDRCLQKQVILGQHLSLAKGENLDEFLGLLKKELDKH